MHDIEKGGGEEVGGGGHIELECTGFHKVNDTAGGADRDLHAAGKRLGLGALGYSAVDAERTHAARSAGFVKHGADLLRELARRRLDEHKRPAARHDAVLALHLDVAQRRQAERERLACMHATRSVGGALSRRCGNSLLRATGLCIGAGSETETASHRML